MILGRPTPPLTAARKHQDTAQGAKAEAPNRGGVRASTVKVLKRHSRFLTFFSD